MSTKIPILKIKSKSFAFFIVNCLFVCFCFVFFNLFKTKKMILSFKRYVLKALDYKEEDLTTVGSGFKEHARRRQCIRFKKGANNIGAFQKRKKKETVADP